MPLHPIFTLNLLMQRNRLVIGLFGLVGMAGVAAAPLIGRTVDRVVPWFATVISIICSLSFYIIQLGAGGVNIAAVVIVAAGIDMFRQSQQVSLLTRVFELDPNARARLNSVMVVSVSFRVHMVHVRRC